jgi:hypothetical protein
MTAFPALPAAAAPVIRKKAKVQTILELLNKDTLPFFQIIAVSAILLSVISAYIFISHGYHNAHFDSKAHQLVARRIFDNLRPGWIQIGAFWLPLPHILYLPLVRYDSIYFSGTAGTPYSMISFICTSLILFKLIEKLLDRFAAFCGTALYITNPNMLYLQTTALTENLAILFMVGSIYLFVQFVDLRERKYLVGCAVVSTLGVLTRYENWLVAALTGFLLVLIQIKERFRWKPLIVNCILFAIPNLLAMGFTFWINWYTTGHIFFDHRSKHTDFQPAQGSFFVSFLVILYTIGKLLSYEWTILALIAFFIVFRKKFRDSRFLAALAILGPLLLYLFEYRDNHPTRVRYGIPFIPACVLFLSYWPTRSRLFAYLFILFTIHISLFSSFYRAGSSELMEESMRDAENLAIQDDLLQYLRQHDDGTLILAAMGDIAPVLYDLKLPIKRYIHEGAKPWWNDANAHPEKVAGWVFMTQGDRLWKRFHDNPEFHRHYALIGRRKFLELYRWNPDEGYNLKSHKPHAAEEIGVIPKFSQN